MPANGSARAPSGGASHKLGLDLPEARTHMAALGAFLDWHGALSADVILGPDGPRFIDINPRLVEPLNALASGVDLTGALLEVARQGSARSARSRRPCPGRGPISYCSPCSARPSRAADGTWRASWPMRCCTAASTGTAGRS